MATSVFACLLCLVSSALFWPACAGEGSSVQEAGGEATGVTSSAPPLRGHLVIGHEVRSFKPCDAEQDLWVLDETGGDLVRVYEELTSAVYQGLYVVLVGQIGASPAEGCGGDESRTIRRGRGWRR